MSRFPAAFRPPAFASRSSDSRRGVGPSSRSAYRARDRVRTPTGLPRSARTSCDRGGRPLYPEDGGALPGLRDVLSRRLPLDGGQSFDPAPASHRQGSASRGINEGSSDSPVRSSPRLWPPGWNGHALGRPLELRAPPSPAAHVEGGDRPSSTDLKQRSTTSAEPPILRVHSLRATSRRTVPSGRVTRRDGYACIRVSSSEP
jgi:hypothetical protein